MAAPARPWSWSTADLGSPPCPKDLSASWLQGQGHNRDIDRPFSYEAFGDDMVLAEMAKVSRSGFEQMKQAPMYQAWLAVAPDVTAFPALMDKTGDPLRRPYDWSKEVRRIDIPTLLSTVTPTASRRHTPPNSSHFGGLKDAGWDGSVLPDGRVGAHPTLRPISSNAVRVSSSESP